MVLLAEGMLLLAIDARGLGRCQSSFGGRGGGGGVPEREGSWNDRRGAGCVFLPEDGVVRVAGGLRGDGDGVAVFEGG